MESLLSARYELDVYTECRFFSLIRVNDYMKLSIVQ